MRGDCELSGLWPVNSQWRQFAGKQNMADVYSQRNAPRPDVLRYDLHRAARQRLFIVLQQACAAAPGCNIDNLISELGAKLVAQYGGLAQLHYEAARMHSDPVVQHLFSCHDAEVLDYLEFFAQCAEYRKVGQVGVDAVNQVFREEGIGYALTNWIVKNSPAAPKGGLGIYAMFASVPTLEIEYPKVIRKDSEFTHESIVKPALNVLAKPAFTQANKELLEAFAKQRHGDFDGALTSCGAALESVFNTICTHKNWTYDAEKDTLSKLVDICNTHKLFPGFYAEVFKSVGTVRNKLSDAHGRGPVPLHNAGQEHLEHLIHFVSAHVVFLAKLAEI